MSTTDTVTLEQQRERRKRINRMKTGIIMTIAIWMIVSFLAIVILSIQLIRLNGKIRNLNDAIELLSENVSQGALQDSTSRQENTQKEEQTLSTVDYDRVVTGIDTPDNMANVGDEHKVYLTFDSVPGENTLRILDVLKEQNIKATFFVSGNESEEIQPIYQRIVAEGHTLGMHSYSNQYNKIYASISAFEEDYKKISNHLEQSTGVKSRFYRFPGGSSNEISNVNMSEFVHVLNQNQITFFDWNVSAGDSAAMYSVSDVVTNVMAGVQKYKTSVVVLQDGSNKATTVDALGPLIESLREMDAEILPIDENTKVIQYIKANSVG